MAAKIALGVLAATMLALSSMSTGIAMGKGRAAEECDLNGRFFAGGKAFACKAVALGAVS